MAELTASPPIAAPSTAGRVPRWVSLGAVFGVVSIAAIALYGPIGVSGTYPRFIGSIARRIAPAYAAANPYLVKMGSLITTETMLVVGLLIGGFLAAQIGGTNRALEQVHATEHTTGARYRDAFIGGLLIIFGARLAGGCTSGHIISGITQLAVSGMLFGAAVFGAGMITAKLLKGGR
ncbi:MAG TPA: YeeE/YedE thiosulfate transporter family protein [Gemmatimonadaceae bacterium]|nr:YeeE/YedE thiosulfate transporter family protein [Gemmatimonadaceae bacterium]